MKHIARVCAGLIVIAYFLPWMNIMIASMSGFNMGKMAISSMGEGPPTPPWIYGSLLFVVFGIASAVINNKKAHLVSGGFVLLVMIWMLADMIAGAGAMISPLELIGIGIWITVLASIGQILGAFRLDASPDSESEIDTDSEPAAEPEE